MKYTTKGILLSAFILLIFITISLYGAYQGSLQVRNFIKEKELPAVGLAVSARLDKAAYRYKKIGEELLEGNALRRWILSGEKDPEVAVTFMREVRDRYDLLDASLVSDKTERYYNTDYTVLQLSPDNERRDGWYYLYRDSVDGVNIDSWHFEKSGLTQVFVNVPIFDHKGNYIGVTGAGINSAKVKEVIVTFEKEYGVRIQLARKDGKVVYTSEGGTKDELTEKTLDTLLRNQTDPMGIVFQGGGKSSSIFWGTYLGDWNSYLVVEKQGDEIEADMRESMLSSFLSLGGFALVLFLISIFTLRSTFKIMKASLEQKEKKISLQETALRFSGRFVRTLDVNGEYQKAMKMLLLWAGVPSEFWENNEREYEKENIPPEEVLDPVLLTLSSRAEQHRISLHSSLEKSGLLVDRDEAFVLDVSVREICRHIFEIAVPGLIIPLAGFRGEEAYTIEIASNMRGSYFSAEILDEVRDLLLLAGFSLSVENSSQRMLSIIISIPL